MSERELTVKEAEPFRSRYQHELAALEELERPMRDFEARVSELYNTHADCLEARRKSFSHQKATAWRLAMAEQVAAAKREGRREERADIEALFTDVTDLLVTTDHPEFGIEVTMVKCDRDETVINQPSVLDGIAAALAAIREVTP